MMTSICKAATTAARSAVASAQRGPLLRLPARYGAVFNQNVSTAAAAAAASDRSAIASQLSPSHPASLPLLQRGLSTQSLEGYCEEESLSQIFRQHATRQMCGRFALKTGDVARVLTAVGDKPSPAGLQQIFEHVDENGDGLIEETEFVNSASHLLTCRHWHYEPPPHMQRSRSLSTGEVHRLFGMLDHDGDGYLSVGDLTGVMSTFGGNLSREEAEMIIRLADGNGDGLVTISEFFRLLDEPRTAAASFKLRSSFNVVLLIGGPGSGKGVLSDRIASNNEGVVHLSSGDLLRAEVAQKTPLGMECAATMEAGGLIKSVTMTRLLKKNCTQYPGHWVLLDGFPRSLKNCQNFERLCGKPDFAVYIDVPDEVMVERIIKRGASSGRVDDNRETAQTRLRTFHEQGVPTLRYLEGQGIPIYQLDGAQSPEDVWRQFQMMNTPLTRSQQPLVGFGSI